MRIATNSYSDSMLNQFNTLAAQQYKLQNQVSTGLRVQSAADDPTAMQNTLTDLEQQAAQNQYSANISTLQTRATSVDGVLQSLQTIVSRAGEIVTAGGNDTAGQSTLTNYADEVNQLINTVVESANTKDPSTGKYLFGGTASGSPPFTTTTDANGHVTAVTYNGNSTVNQAQIGAGLTASADIPGANTGSTGARGLITDSQSGADLINHLIQLRDDLNSGNTTAITGTDSANIQKDENNVAYQVANNGVLQNQLTNASSFASSSNTNLTQMISNSSSADLMNTMVALNQAQTAYQAALQSSAKIMQESLVNYLK
jgi:flagellar hook-associated protein 3 FlgL